MTLRVTPAEIVAAAESSGHPGLLVKAPSWDRVLLGEVARVVNGAPYDSSHFNVEQRGMPLVRIRDVGARKFSTWYDGEWSDLHRVCRGDLLVGMDGNFTVDQWHLDDAVLNQRVCRIEVDENRMDSRFLEFALQGYLDAIWDRTSSTTVKHLSSRTIAHIPLPSPPLDEQHRIVEILEEHLSRIDHALVIASSVMAKAKALMRARVDHAFQFAGSSRRPLGDVIDTSRTGWSRGQRHLVESGTGVPYVKMQNIANNGGLDLGTLVEVAVSPEEQLRYELVPGDVLFNSKNSFELVGKSAVVDARLTGAVFNENLTRLRLSEVVNPQYFVEWVSSPSSRRLLQAAASASTSVAAIYLHALKTIAMPVPSLQVQKLIISQCVSAREELQRSMSEIERVVRRSAALRRALLQAAFSGQLTGRTSDLDRAEELVP